MASGKSPKPVTSAVIKMRANRRLYLGVPILNSSRNCKFITRKQWGFYDLGGAFMHHGKFTTAREAVEAHNGEALAQRLAFDGLPPHLQNALIEFLKSLQVLPLGSKSLVVDEHGNPKDWPPSAVSSEDER